MSHPPPEGVTRASRDAGHPNASAPGRGIVIPALVMVASLTGCVTKPQHPSATQRATTVDLATTQPAYWLDQPAIATVSNSDFDRLFSACESAAREFLFRIDRIDYRAGLLVTYPMVSKQWFEFWRHDAQTWDEISESSLATIRRTVRFQFSRRPDDTFDVTPLVLVERQTNAEQRITSAVGYRTIFRRPAQPSRRARGTVETDAGVMIPDRYWTPIGRDPALERALAKSIERKLAPRS